MPLGKNVLLDTSSFEIFSMFWCVHFTLTFLLRVSVMNERSNFITSDLKCSFIPCVFTGEETLLEEHITQSLNKLCSDVHHTTFQVIFVPISVQLEQVQSAPAWSNANKQAATVAADLPDFSFAPQEYITQVKL